MRQKEERLNGMLRPGTAWRARHGTTVIRAQIKEDDREEQVLGMKREE